jgi:RNA polymerase sigma factor (sigma-70 family)
MRNGTTVAANPGSPAAGPCRRGGEQRACQSGAGEAALDAAFENLFRHHQRTVYTWILRIVRNPAVAEDLTIETFWRIHHSMDRFDPARGFTPWARCIASHVAIDWLRTPRCEVLVAEDFFAHVPSAQAADPVIAAEIRAKVARAFGRLPAKLSAAAALAVVEGLPHKEIAAALGISVAAVKLRVFRALRMLRKDLRGQGITP